MSAVAPAVKSVSDSPAKNAVTDPTNQTILQDDVDRKLKFYAVIQAFRAGRLPDNKQIDETLEYVKKTSPIDIAKLSPDGKRLIDDARAIIETARLIVQEKNHDELFQNFVAHTSGIDVKDKVRQPSVDTPVSADQAKKDGDVAVKHLRTLLQLLLTNSESRKLLSDLTLISRDLFAVGAAKGAEKLRPTEAQLAAVDDAAPRSEWKDSDKGLKDTVKTLGQELKDTHVEANTNGATTTAAPVTTAAPITTTSNTMPTAVAQPQAAPATDGVAAPPAKKSSFMARITGRASTDKAEKDKVVNKEQVDQTAAVSKEKANKAKAASKEQYDKAKSFLTEEYFPAERRDQFIWRFKKLIVECQSHPKYAEALEWFINTLDVYFGHARSTAAAGGNQSKAIFENDPTLQRSVNELRTLLERFANGASMTPIFNATDRIWEDAQHDEALKGWWSKLSAFARKSLLEPGFIISPQFDNQWNALRDEGSQLFNGRYKDHKDHLFDAISAFFKSFADDPLNKRFGEDWTRLTKHLLFGEDGKSLSYKPQLWKDVRSVILPQLVQQVGYIPIPRIEYSDDKLDLVIENLTLQGRNLFPNVFEMVFNNHFKFSPYANIKDVQNHTISFTLSQIQADMRDVAFYFRRKAGFGKVKDSGLADVFLGGKGITVFVKVHSQGMDARSSEMGGRIFKVKSVKVKVDTLKFAIRDSHHNLLYKVVRPLATGLIKKQIAKALEDAIRTGLEALDDQLVEIRGKMDHDPNDKEFSRMGVLKDHYSSKKSEASSRASTIATKRQSRFNMVPKRESLILPDVGYEKGWIKRQAEREELVGQGEGWKSSAFTIVPNGSLPIPMKA